MKYIKKAVNYCLLFAALLAFGSTLQVSAYAENSRVEDAQNSVVRVFVEMADGVSIGSGFAVGGEDEDVEIIITNYHVIADDPNNAYVTVTDINGGIPAMVIYSDDKNDFAVLKLDRPLTEREPIALLSPKELHKSQNVYCIGFPGLSDEIADNRAFGSRIKDMTITTGTVSNNEYTDLNGTACILSDAKVNRGNSGGPMVDEYGQAVGINTAVIGADGNTLNNMTLAVSIDYVTKVLDDKGITYIKGSADGKTQKNSDAGDSLFDDWADSLLYIIVGVVAVVAVATATIIFHKHGKFTTGTQADQMNHGGANSSSATVQRKLVVCCERGTLQGQTVSSFDIVRIGRNTGTCRMAFPDGTPGVSKEHCELCLVPGGITVRDLGSTYGTYLANGYRIQPGERKNIGSEGIISLGSDKVVISAKIMY